MFVRLDAPAMVSLFAYDNDKFIVESFAENPVQARIITDARITKLHDVVTGEELTAQAPAGGGGGRGGRGGGRGGAAPTTTFQVNLTQGSYRVFSAD
jgi:hypothetical protein